MNEQRFQQVLEIEKQALAIYESAVHDAEQLQKQAEQEAQLLIEKAQAKARKEAQRLVENAEANEEAARILAQSEDKSRQLEAMGEKYFDRAVRYALDHIIGRE